MNLIDELSEDHEQRIDEKVTAWRDVILSTEPADRIETERKIARFYGQSGFAYPKTIWCDSPWQMAALAFVLQVIKRSNRDRACKRWLRTIYHDAQWQAMWDQYDLHAMFLDKLLEVDRDNSLLDSRETKELKDLIFVAMWKQRDYIESALKMQFSAKALSDVEVRVNSNLLNPMWNAVRVPLEANLRMQLTDLGNRALAQLNSQVTEKEFSGRDDEVIKRFRNTRKDAVYDTRFGASSLKTLVKKKVWNRSTIMPFIMHRKNYFPYIFLNSNLPIEVDKIVSTTNWPWQDSSPLIHKICFDLLGIAQTEEMLKTFDVETWCEFMKSCLAILPMGSVVLACDRPSKLSVDEWGRLHCIDGPAMTFPDGYQIYCWHGNIVEPLLIEHPETITLQMVESESNVERRRILIEVFGESRFLHESGAQVIDESEYGILYKKPLQADEDLVMVKVLNATVEPDGSIKPYYLRVPPTITTAKEAVAWTFRMNPEEYDPNVQS